MGSDRDGEGDSIAAVPRPHRAAKGKARLVPSGSGNDNTNKGTRRDVAGSCPSSSASSSPQQQKGVRVKGRRRACAPLLSHVRRRDDGLRDLALPLGMSFAAIIAKFSDGKKAGEKIPVDHLSRICTSAVEESITDIYGDKFECFMRNFEKSFSSTLRTLRLINEASTIEQENTSCSYVSGFCDTAPIRDTCGSLDSFEESQGSLPFNSINSQLILHGQPNQQLAPVSQSIGSSGCNQSILSTFEKSVMEQTRSNDLKAVEISLTMKRLQLKQSQLALNSYANLLEKMKISMGISKASFKEEKLRNQMQDTRYAELLRSCMDLLVAGLIIMCSFLVYGAYIYSYQRITEATSSCTSTPKEAKSWWIPKPMATFTSGWHMLRCHVVVLTRMSFGILMILVIAYSLIQRSLPAGPSMPVTFILLLLGAACGVAGKLCVDTLGGNGYCWLIYWEFLCFLHFFSNVFPATLYHILHGPLCLSQENKVARLPYWVRRYTFYGILVLILPTLSGLLPFASIHDWKDHFSEKISQWNMGNEEEL